MQEQRQPADVADLPRFGYKQSGYGKDMGICTVEEYARIERVMISHD